VLLLVELVAGCVKGARGTVGDGVLAGDVALGLLLVGLLGRGGGGALDGLRNVVGGVLRGTVSWARKVCGGVEDVRRWSW
jgi:hypothetical protein